MSSAPQSRYTELLVNARENFRDGIDAAIELHRDHSAEWTVWVPGFDATALPTPAVLRRFRRSLLGFGLDVVRVRDTTGTAGQLLRRVLVGESAIDAVFERVYERIRTIAAQELNRQLPRLKRHLDAGDLPSRVFDLLLTRLERPEPLNDSDHFRYTIRDVLRYELLTQAGKLPPEAVPLDGHDSPEAPEYPEDIRELLSLLDPRTRDIIEWIYIDELSLVAIAARLGLTPQRIGQIHKNALAALKAHLREQ